MLVAICRTLTIYKLRTLLCTYMKFIAKVRKKMNTSRTVCSKNAYKPYWFKVLKPVDNKPVTNRFV